jgi:hypothetical protein
VSTYGDVIETTAGEVAAELARRGVAPGERVTVRIGGDETATAPARPKLAEIAARMRITAVAQGLTVDIFDELLRSKP